MFEDLTAFKKGEMFPSQGHKSNQHVDFFSHMPLITFSK